MDDVIKIDFTVSSYKVLERQLVECMEYLPFIEGNKFSISPKFIPIIMDSCSLIDSIFFDITQGNNKERYSLKKYSTIHEPALSLNSNASLLLLTPVQIIQPYKNWIKQAPLWWGAYNKLKHDRLNNFHYATYTNAIYCLAGLHQLMAKQRNFIGSFLKAGWIDTNDIEVIDNLGSAAHVGSRVDVIVESSLFVSATDENFVNPDSSDEFYFDVNYESKGLSHRVRNLLFAHEDW
jgi:hypothetical protein